MSIYHFNEIYMIIYIVMDEITKFLSLTHACVMSHNLFFFFGEKKPHSLVMFKKPSISVLAGMFKGWYPPNTGLIH